MRLIEDLFNVLAADDCLVCRREGGLLCLDCANSLKRVPERCYRCKKWSQGFLTCQACRRYTPVYKLLTITPYEAEAKRLVQLLKFERAKAAAELMATILAAHYGLEKDVIITHVPTVGQRVRQRGYDQAALIARNLSRFTGLPYAPLLSRLGHQRQLGQSRAIRKEQMEQAFRPLKTQITQGKHVLLIDDVLTTGATCEAAARVLRRAGAKRVSAAVFAVA